MVSDPLDPRDLPEVFPHLEPHITRVASRFEGVSPEEVYRLLETGAATLHSISGEGFFIAQWTKNKCYCLFAAATEKVTRTPISVIISKTADYAKQLGCSELCFGSDRPAWARIAKRLNFTAKDGYYTKEL